MADYPSAWPRRQLPAALPERVVGLPGQSVLPGRHAARTRWQMRQPARLPARTAVIERRLLSSRYQAAARRQLLPDEEAVSARAVVVERSMLPGRYQAATRWQLWHTAERLSARSVDVHRSMLPARHQAPARRDLPSGTGRLPAGNVYEPANGRVLSAAERSGGRGRRLHMSAGHGHGQREMHPERAARAEQRTGRLLYRLCAVAERLVLSGGPGDGRRAVLS